MTDHKMPGEMVYKNMVLNYSQPISVIDRIPGLEAIEGEVLIASYPKTGTTWLQEISWLITNNCDFQAALSNPIYLRSPFLEFQLENFPSGLDLVHQSLIPRPAVMKTHLQADFLRKPIYKNENLKVIVPIRNPKDTLVSDYHFYRMNQTLGNFLGTWDEFFELYKTKHMLYGDYFDWYADWLEFTERPNVFLIKYEDMKADPTNAVRQLSKFLDTPLDEENIEKIVQHTSFDNMQNNKMINMETAPIIDNDISKFIRKGEVGDWQNYFNEEQSKYVDQQYRDKLGDKVNLRFL